MKEFILQNRFDPARCNIDYRKELNAEQLDVVLNGDGPCLVLAGAGSGKTRTVTYRVSYLIENGIAPSNILLVTFTNKAAREMLGRVEGLLHTAPAGLWGGTFHSIANRLLRVYAPQVGRTAKFTILDEEDARELIKACVKELAVDTTARRFPSPGTLHAILSFSVNSGTPVREAIQRKHPSFRDIVPTVERIAELYEARKAAADVVDFDDLLVLLRRLLFNNAAVRDRLASQFQYVLVDEYQDTNAVQADIVRQLSSVHNNVLVVGDDAQSIYSFRAARIRNILDFPSAYSDARTFRLVTNYRSTPEILSLANAVIRHNRDQFEKDLRAVRGAFEKPSLVPAANQFQEAQYIVEQILALRDDGVALRDMAVLFRGSFQSQALEFELAKRDVPYDFRGGMKFFQRAHIKDVVAHLRIVANVRDELAWTRVLGMQPGVGSATAAKMVASFRPYDSCDQLVRSAPSFSGKTGRAAEAVLSTLRNMLASPRPADMIRAVIAGGYRDYLEAEHSDFMERLDDLEQFALFAEPYDEVSRFLEEVTLTDDYGAGREEGGTDDRERLVLSTIHQAKGLEWDAVFVMGLVDGKFPHQRALDEDGGLEEERRLFYVAATRARRRLFLTYPISGGDDTLMFSQPSQFIQELPDGLVEEVRLRASTSRLRGPGSPRPSWEDDGPTIVLDELGEREPIKPTVGSFLRNVEDL
jgi:DNA helicase-2/ATP-dependent DNA helicase PcrA